MACLTCTGTCTCPAVIIPVGPQGSIGPTGLTGGVGPTGVQGPTGAIGPAGATPAKYAANFTVLSGGTVTSISKAAIISCNALLNTCASTPTDYDFNITIWWQTAGSQWREVTNNTSYITSITYDTSASTLQIINAAAAIGTFRVVISG